MHSSGIVCASQDEGAPKLEMDHSPICPVLTCETTLCFTTQWGGKGHQRRTATAEKCLSILWQRDAGSQLLSSPGTTPSTRDGCLAKQAPGVRGEPGREQRVRADCCISRSVPEIWHVCILVWRDLAVPWISGEWVNSQLGCPEERLFLWNRFFDG